MLYTQVGSLDLEAKFKDKGNFTTCEEWRANAMNNNHQASKKYDRKNWKTI